MSNSAIYPTLGFIGAGNMAAAIIGGLLAEGYPADRITATDPSAEKLRQMAADWGIQTTSDNARAVSQSEVVVLAVKPQVLGQVSRDLRQAVAESAPLVISIAAGVMASSLENWLGEGTSLVRCMPNTPALVQTGASGLFANACVSVEQQRQAEQIMTAVGMAVWVESEAMLDAVTAVSGSGPAYYFMMMESMIAAGEQLGLDRQTCTQLTLQTALGAAKMALASDVDPAELRRRVTSPNGTTEKAVEAFESGGLKNLVAEAMDACARRSEAMAVELGED